MAHITKKRKSINGKVDPKKLYNLDEACSLVKEVNTTKFDASVDLHIRLGVDPRKPDQAIRGTVTCLLYTSPSPRDRTRSRMPSSA